jgi:hypothetical protein
VYLGLGDLVCDSQNTSDVLSDITDFGTLGGSTASNLANAKGLKLLLQVSQLVHQLTLGLGSKFESSDFSCEVRNAN